MRQMREKTKPMRDEEKRVSHLSTLISAAIIAFRGVN
jgi:hypothetical protein